MEPVALVRQWIASLDAGLGEALERFECEQGHPVSCHTCTVPGCCRQMVLCHLFEGLPIAARLVAEGRDTVELHARLRRDADQIDRDGAVAWFDRGPGCAFLADGRCSVYEDRPTPCRAYYVTTPPELCSARSGTRIAYLPCRNEADEHAVQAASRIHRELGLRAHRVYIDTLPRVVLRLLRARSRQQPAWAAFVDRQAWPGLEQIERWEAR
jgi:Fe-S-cluster containining protein